MLIEAFKARDKIRGHRKGVLFLLLRYRGDPFKVTPMLREGDLCIFT